MWLRIFALGGFAVLTLHVMAAAACGSNFWEMMKVMATAPGYILWKLWILPEVWRASYANAAWVRTARESHASIPLGASTEGAICDSTE
jgi:hypothetical protein